MQRLNRSAVAIQPQLLCSNLKRMVHVSTAFETGAVGCECILQPQYKEDEMSSKIINPYFGPTDFRKMREILRRAGYRLYDTAENRAAHIFAARLLIQEFQSGRSPS
jgi:hypothetical protein